MSYVINCECGYTARGETEDELVADATQHIEQVHPKMAGATRDQILAMAEEE